MSQDIKEWIDILANSASQDPDVSGPANEAISEKINSDGESLIAICTQILKNESQNDERIKQSQNVASSILSQMLNISNESDLDFNRKNLSPETVDHIKDSLQESIFSDDTTVHDNCCQIYSFLFATLTTNWQDGIDVIVNSFGNDSLLPYGFNSLFIIMRNIVNQINFQNEIIEPFNQQFLQTLSFSISIISQDATDEKYPPILRSSCINFMSDLIQKSPKVIKITENDGNSDITVYNILDSLSNCFKIYDENLYTSIYTLLYTLTDTFYRQAPEFFERIVNYVDSGFDLVTTHPQCCMISINFWRSVSLLERRIIDLSSISEKLNKVKSGVEPLSPLLCEAALNHLMPKLIQIIESIDANDTDVENFKIKPFPCMYANRVISAFYKILPEEVFNIITAKIKEKLEDREKWTDKYSIISMVYTICEEPTNDAVAEFINDIFDFIIECSMPDQIPRLSETALYVLNVSIKQYHSIISEVNPDERIKKVIKLIAGHISSYGDNLTPNGLCILNRCSQTLHGLFNVWKEHIYDSKVSTYFDQFQQLVGQLFDLGVKSENELLIKNSGEALNNLIFNSTLDVSDKIKDLYASTLTKITQCKALECSQKVRYLIASSLCSNVSSFLIKLRGNLNKNNDIINELAPKTLEILYDLLSNKDIDIYEEGMLTISALISATSSKEYYVDLFTPETFNRLITEFIYNGLTSLNESVTNSTCLLIGNLYYYLSSKIPDLIQVIPDIFDVLSTIIYEHKEIKASFPFILKAIGDIFNYFDFSQGQKPDLSQQLADLLKSVYDLSSSLDITKDADVNYGNLFYTYLCQAFAGYAKTYYDYENFDVEREQLFMLDKLSFYIWKMAPKLNDDLLMAFMKTARQFAEYCSRRNNVILNRHSVHRILRFAIENTKNIELKKKIKDTIEYLKSK